MSTATLARPAAKSPSAKPKPRALNLPQLVRLDRIEPDPRNPRLEAAETVEGLAGSLDTLELLNPVHVRPNGKPGCYVLICGERRFRAAQRAGWKEIPAVVRDVSDAEAAEIMISENAHTRRLSPLELARAVELLCRRVNKGGAGMTRNAAARLLGKSRRWVYRMLGVLKLPLAWQERIAAGKVSFEAIARLVRLVERPDVLAAVEADVAANPTDWGNKETVNDRLAFVVAQLDNLANPPGVASVEVEPISRKAHDTGSTEAPDVLAPIGRRSAPVDHASASSSIARLPGGSIDSLSGEQALPLVLALIGRLESKDQLAAVDDCLNRRDEVLTAELTAAVREQRRQGRPA